MRNRIQETREDIGETVASLAHKADVKGRAADAAEVAKGKAAEVIGKVREVTPDQVKDTAGKVVGKVRDATPDQVKDTADKVTTAARKRPVLLIAAAGAIVLLLLRRARRRHKAE